jgi:hypothetical protein
MEKAETLGGAAAIPSTKSQIFDRDNKLLFAMDGNKSPSSILSLLLVVLAEYQTNLLVAG